MNHDDLFEKRFLGTLTPAETAELKRLLRDDRQAQRDFVRFTQERGILIQLAGRSEVQVQPAGGRRRFRRFAREGGPSVRILAGAAAVLVAALAGIFAAMQAPPVRPAISKPTAPPVDVERRANEEMANVEQEARKAQDRLAEIERERVKESDVRRREGEVRKAREELAALEARREAAERELEKAREDRRKADEERARLAAEAAARPSPVPAPTIASVATLEKVHGDVIVTAGEGRSPATNGKTVLAGEGLAALEATATATLAFADGTRIELGGDTVVKEVVERTSSEVGKSFYVARGTVTARVARQPGNAALAIRTPQGEARVLGTQLRVAVEASTTRVDVREGKVRLSRTSDAKTVEVEAGQYAVTSDLLAKPILTPRIDEALDELPVWAGQWDATWGRPALWALQPSPSGRALTATRPQAGSSVKTLVYAVPANTVIEISVLMKCPKFAGGWFAETAFRPGIQTPEDFDLNPKEWTMVKKFDSYGGQNGNGNGWMRYAAQVHTGAFTQITVGFKTGARSTAGPAVAWDALRISW